MKHECKDCKQPCCEGTIHVRITNDDIILIPLTKKKMNIDGIPLKRITARVWRCEWLNKKTGKCKNYKGRPTVCRNFLCKDYTGPNKSKPTLNTSIYGLGFPKYMQNKRFKKCK